MGDSGSLLLGFSFAAVTLSAGRTRRRADRTCCRSSPAPVLVLLIPIFDTTLVTLSRWFSGRRAAQGGRDHSSHRLVAIGLSERRAVAVLWLLAAIGGALGVALELLQPELVGAGGRAAFLVGMVLFAAYLAGIRVYDDTDARVKQGALTPIVVDFMYKRRVAEVLLDFCLDRALLLRRLPAALRGSGRLHEELRELHAVAAGRRRRRRWWRSSSSASIAACGGTSA